MAEKFYVLAAIASVWVCLTTENALLFMAIAAYGLTIGFACLYSGWNRLNVKRAAIVFGIVAILVGMRALVPVETVNRTARGTELVTTTFFTGKVIRVQKIGD